MHTNMFGYGHPRREVKEALIADQKRGSRDLKILDAVVAVCVIYLLRDRTNLDGVAIFVGIFCALSGVRYFVDQSVRNFFLHRLDWEETRPDDGMS